MKLNIFNSLIGLCVATAVVSCSDALVDNFDNRPVGGEASDMISFVVGSNNNTTRGGSFGNRPCGGAYLRIANGADSLYLNMEVSDIADDLSTRTGEISATSLPASLYMYCRINAKDGKYYYFDDELFANDNNGNVWSSKTPYYWLDNDTHYRFFGYYAPEDRKSDWVKNGEKVGQDRIPTIDYTTPDDVRKHFDLSYSVDPLNNELSDANSEYIATQKVLVPVHMTHALSLIILKTGSNMANGTINSVSIKKVCNKGNLNLGTGDWNLEKVSEGSDVNTTNGEFTLSGLSVSGNEKSITGDNSFFLLPQEIKEGAEIELEFTPYGKTEPDTYVASLAGLKWEAGKKYTYTINIDPEYGIELVDYPETVDAHYVIAQAYINAENFESNKQWELVVSAEHVGANDKYYQPSVLWTSDLNEFQQDGYWIDNVYSDNACNNLLRGARGDMSIKGGNGTKIPISIFIPENSSNADRKIICEFKVDGNTINTQEIIQKCPGWTSSNGIDYGWEQIQDSEGEFGFKWTKVVYYGYKYNAAGHDSEYKNYCINIISDNNAEGYASVEDYWYYSGIFPLKRYEIKIDYNKFSQLNGYNADMSNGESNTIQLYTISGQSAIGTFEKVLRTIKKTKGDLSDPYAFGCGDEGNGRWGDKSTGENSPNAPAVGECLKKNRYQLVETISSDGENEHKELKPVIKNSDIVWYLPAVNQFKSIPSILDPINKADYWSSTAVNDGAKAFLGDGTTEVRTITHKIRACRKRTNN